MASPTFLTSPLLESAGIVHGWFTRSGGVSRPPFDSLNVKRGFADLDANVTQNRRRALGALGLQLPDLVFIHHEHDGQLLQATHDQAGKDLKADAIVSSEPSLVLGQGTADCGTIILATKDGKTVGLVHASWRTLRKGLVERAAKQFSGGEVLAAIGPLACANCYEFGPEADELFESRYVSRQGGKRRIDLRSMIADQLRAAGITQIDDLDICTMEDPRFFSHRRDHNMHGETGRFLTLVSRSRS